MWVCVGCGGIISCSDWHKIVLLFRSILHVILKVMPHTAHRRSLLSAAGSNSSRTHLARSSTVHLECSDTMRSRKAQCQALQDSPETGNTYNIYISQSRNQKKLRWREKRAPKRVQAAQQQQCGYACIQARLISTNPGSMEEAYEYRLPRGTCFAVRSLELVPLAGRLWMSWCVWGWADF